MTKNNIFNCFRSWSTGVAARCIAFGLLLCTTLSSQAAGETQGDIVLFPGTLAPFESNAVNPIEPSKAITKKYGWNLPGTGYRAGSGWWALSCDAAANAKSPACSLTPTNLSVSRGTHPVYDGEPVPSQLLYWSPLPGAISFDGEKTTGNARLLFLFKPLRSLAAMKLSAGPVDTYLHGNMKDYPKPPTPGTLEVRIPMGAGQFADIVPRTLPAGTREVQNIPMQDVGYPFDFLELRIGPKRQRISGLWTGCSTSTLRPAIDYLWWAGDLDGDGKLDFVLSRDGSDHLVLYLSSQAKEGELVGEAGSFQYSNPAQGEC
ncbi:MAG: hypothetical protein H7293_01025 [Candidatus Saccharibacteria bacterium]|nr:hypothetical protein [Rhodoferax sp.]